MQLQAGIVEGELPADAGVSGVALGFEGAAPMDERVRVRDWAREAAALDDAELDLGHREG